MGYVFPNDRWEKASYNCVLSKRKKYTSSKVEGELRKKSKYAMDRITGEIRQLTLSLNEKKQDVTVQDKDIEGILKRTSNTKISPTLRLFFGDPARKGLTYKQLREWLNRIQWYYLGEVHVRTKRVEELLSKMDIESWSRFKPYTDIQAGLSALVANASDVELLLDAHDLALELNVTLDFVTGDWTDIKDKEKGILALVRLRRIMYLAEFESAS
ncbi:MAG: hypothetical protein AB1665_05245 [Candidatus Thermoplasmatota archaeon]